MKKFAILAAILLAIVSSCPAEAVTISNKCHFPVAGSLRIAENNVNVAQFRVLPGAKVHLLKNFSKTRLILRTVPDTYRIEDISESSHDLDSPDCYIELKGAANKIVINID